MRQGRVCGKCNDRFVTKAFAGYGALDGPCNADGPDR